MESRETSTQAPRKKILIGVSVSLFSVVATALFVVIVSGSFPYFPYLDFKKKEIPPPPLPTGISYASSAVAESPATTTPLEGGRVKIMNRREAEATIGNLKALEATLK